LLDRRALDVLFSAMYEELRRLAATIKRADPSATLNPTALVNEAWVKLARSPRFRALSPLHFKRIAARAMRQVLVDAARRRRSGKRDAAFVTIDDAHVPSATLTSDAIIALDVALDELGRANPRQALLVESRYFGGLDVVQTAALLKVSEATVQRDWRAARAWLASRVERASRT
jgi:RNA polymerase sigma factor (TIGR02999 family)